MRHFLIRIMYIFLFLTIALYFTEGVAMANPEDVIEKLQQLKELNILISIDDFGMGYSSLNYLKKLPIHQLKS